MNRRMYLETLNRCLYQLPEEDRAELLRDYESHFAIGLAKGKSEEDIAIELGNPLDIARDAIGSQFLAPLPLKPANKDTTRLIGVSIVLFFLNLFVLPLWIAFWALFISFCAATVSLCASLVLLLLDVTMSGQFHPGKLFASIGTTGFGLIFIWMLPAFWRGISTAFIAYLKWIRKLWRGTKI